MPDVKNLDPVVSDGKQNPIAMLAPAIQQLSNGLWKSTIFRSDGAAFRKRA
jgi:hypothetical protein